jgi:hypothetical protein
MARIQGRARFPDIFAVDSAGLEEGQRGLAKKSDHLAVFEAEDTGGLFSTLLAEEDELDRRGTLWRLAAWGAGTVAAVVIALMVSQTSLGWRRDQSATAELVQQASRLQAAARESQNEARRLAAAIETLNKDRDRLYTRVTVLEQGLESVTGAISKQKAQPPTPAQPDAQAAAVQAPAPAATAPSAPSEKPAAKPGAETDAASASAPAKNATAKPVATPATPLVEAASMMAPPDPAAGRLIEPAKPAAPESQIAVAPSPPVMAAAPPIENAEPEATEAILPKIQRTEFGIDVGGANSVAGLRALWRGLLKSRANAPLAALQPIIVIREGKGGMGMQLRLVAGPLGDAAAAAKLCAALTENNRPCETAVYDGQRLQIKADDAPADGKPAAPARKKNAPPKRAAVEEPAAKPEPAPQPTSNWASSFFGKKNAQ